MRKGILVTVLLISLGSMAQKINYFRLEVGPKYDRFQVSGNQNVEPQWHTDVSAGIFLGKRFTESAFAELGVVKHDYVSKVEIATLNTNGDRLVTFGDRLVSTFNSVQLGLIGGYEWAIKPRVNAYAKAGFQIFINKTLSQEGSTAYIEEAKNTVIGYAEPIEVTVFSNGIEAGNLIFRGDVGMNYYFGNNVFLEASISGRAGNTMLSEYEIQYQSQSMQGPLRAKVRTSGQSIGFYLGVRYRIADFQK